MGLIRVAARTAVISGTATAVSGRVAQRQALQYNEKVQAQQAAAPAAPAAPAAAPAADDSMAKLQQLAELHGQGVLSDEEFTAAKAKVLGI
ncbi:MAG: SHOCT domain-containing protein [Actinobacteria bacterium]|nr:SHOCT domain-containing protein [Actinomycetota bacterium]